MNIGEHPLPKPEGQKEEDLHSELESLLRELKGILNGGILFSDNVDCKLVSFESHGTPDTEKVLAHGLGKTPTGYIIYKKDKAGDLYTGATTWTSTNIYLKCSVATVTFRLLVF